MSDSTESTKALDAARVALSELVGSLRADVAALKAFKACLAHELRRTT